MTSKANENTLETSALLRLLADLHAVELTADKREELLAANFPGLERGGNGQSLDELATDFADIYLNGSLHASPSESAWLDEDGLVCQKPMFEVREWYARHELGVPDWHKMADDHLVNQLLFIAFLLEEAAANNRPALLEEAARFMDEHLLLWLSQFCHRITNRCRTPFYAYLALLTLTEADNLRELLAGITGIPVPDPDTLEASRQQRQAPQADAQPMHYYPGAAPSW
jgi:TorA maturation chaperone TorD